MKYDAVLFDMDGTVLDTLSDLADAVNHTLTVYGMPPRTHREVASFLGNGAVRLMSLSVAPDTPPELFDEILPYYKAYYDAHCSIKTRPYDGIPALMRALRDAGVHTAIISNKPDFAVQELAREFFPGVSELTVGEKSSVRRKPAPDMVLAALDELGVEKSRAVYVGDTEVDAMTAANAGIDCLGVTWGFRDRAQLEKESFTMLFDSVGELARFLLS